MFTPFLARQQPLSSVCGLGLCSNVLPAVGVASRTQKETKRTREEVALQRQWYSVFPHCPIPWTCSLSLQTEYCTILESVYAISMAFWDKLLAPRDGTIDCSRNTHNQYVRLNRVWWRDMNDHHLPKKLLQFACTILLIMIVNDNIPRDTSPTDVYF